MNKISQELEKWMNNMLSLFPWITFKYEVTEERNIHQVCVYPRELIDSCDEYCREEIYFSMKMEDLYPNETLLFSTEENIFSCSENAKVYRTQPITRKSIESVIEFKYNYECTTTVDMEEHNYSLAA